MPVGTKRLMKYKMFPLLSHTMPSRKILQFLLMIWNMWALIPWRLWALSKSQQTLHKQQWILFQHKLNSWSTLWLLATPPCLSNGVYRTQALLQTSKEKKFPVQLDQSKMLSARSKETQMVSVSVANVFTESLMSRSSQASSQSTLQLKLSHSTQLSMHKKDYIQSKSKLVSKSSQKLRKSPLLPSQLNLARSQPLLAQSLQFLRLTKLLQTRWQALSTYSNRQMRVATPRRSRLSISLNLSLITPSRKTLPSSQTNSLTLALSL